VKEKIAKFQTSAEHWSPEETLKWAFATFQRDIAMASGFGAEGMVLIDMASRIQPAFRIFTLDTEFLFSETYDLMDRAERRYGIKIERVYSEFTPEEQERRFGPALWSHNPDKCCKVRKVDPFQGKLAELRAWITAIRRDQTSSRAAARKVEWDTRFQRVKVNPLADWSSDMVWTYIRKHKVPYNPLHDQNYPSIGCTHCTRAVRAGEDARAGRWSGFAKNECGLHAVDPPLSPFVQIKASLNCEEP
jgi:phosphoadenosine phosphosulfate reductase